MAVETAAGTNVIAAAAAVALAAQVAAMATQDRPAPSTCVCHSIDKLDGTMAIGQSNYNARSWIYPYC